MNPAAILSSGLTALQLDLPAPVQARLLAFIQLLAKWNRSYNLTAVRDAAGMVSHHLLDSLAILPALAGVKTLADVGSGAGLPGLPLAMARADLQVASIDASQKKCSFQQQAKIELGLSNVSIHSARVERWQPETLFDAVVSRAFADLALFVRLAGHLVASGGRLLAMKGRAAREEAAQIPVGWRLAGMQELHVPGLAAQRHLLVLEKN